MIRGCSARCPRIIFTGKLFSLTGRWITSVLFRIRCLRPNESRRIRCPIRLDSPPRLRWKTGEFLLDAPPEQKPVGAEKLFLIPASPDIRKFSPIQAIPDRLFASPIRTSEMLARILTMRKPRVRSEEHTSELQSLRH